MHSRGDRFESDKVHHFLENIMNDFEKERLKEFSDMLDQVIMECESHDDIIMLSSLFLVYARKLLAFGATDETLSDELIFDYINNKIHSTPRTAV